MLRAGQVRDHELDRARRALGRVAVEQREPHHHLLEPEVPGGGREPAREPLRHVRIEEDGGRHEQRDAVPLQPALRDRARRGWCAARGSPRRRRARRRAGAGRPRARRRASGCARRPARRCARRPAPRGCARGSSRCRRRPGSARARSCRGGRDRCGAPSRDGCRAASGSARRPWSEYTKVRCASSPSGATAFSVRRSGAPATPSADSSGFTSASRVRRRPPAGRTARSRATGGQPSPCAPSAPIPASRTARWTSASGAQVAASTLRPPASSKRSYQPSPRSEETWRSGTSRRVEPAQVGGHRDRAAARIGVAEPAPDAVEDRARRVGQVQQHLLGRLGRARSRPPPARPRAARWCARRASRSPAARRSRRCSRPRRRPPRPTPDRACRRSARARSRAPASPPRSTPLSRERRHAADHADQRAGAAPRRSAGRRAGAAPRARARRCARGS